MKLDLSKFKKIASNEKTTTMQHVDGHKIIIAHKALKPAMKHQLTSMTQHLNSGGEAIDLVEKYMAENPEGPSIPQQAQQDYASEQSQKFLKQYDDFNAAPVQSAPQPMAESSPAGLAPDSNAPPAQPADPYGTEAYSNAYMKGIGEQKQGLGMEAGAVGQEGAALEKAAINQQDLDKQLMGDQQKNNADIFDQRKKLMSDLANNHINPNHFLENQTTGQRVMSIIGLIAGGIGGALTHSESAGAKMLQQQIDRDIEAQKSELGKKETLLSANFKQFGDMQTAMSMTRIMQNDIYSQKMKEIAAKTMDPTAKAKLLQQVGGLDTQSAQIQGNIAARKAMTGIGSSPNIDPATKINMFVRNGMIPEKDSSAYYKELKEAEAMTKGRDNVLSAFDKISQINTFGNRLWNPIQSKAEVDALIGTVLPSLSKETAGRFTAEDAKYIHSIFSKPFQGDAAVQVARNAMVKLLGEKMNFPMLRPLGLDPSNSGRYSPQGVNKIQLQPAVRK